MSKEKELKEEIKTLSCLLSRKKAELKALVQERKALVPSKSKVLPSELGKELCKEVSNVLFDRRNDPDSIDETVALYKELLTRCKTKEDMMGFGEGVCYVFTGRESYSQMRCALDNFIEDRYQKWKRDLDIIHFPR